MSKYRNSEPDLDLWDDILTPESKKASSQRKASVEKEDPQDNIFDEDLYPPKTRKRKKSHGTGVSPRLLLIPVFVVMLGVLLGLANESRTEPPKPTVSISATTIPTTIPPTTIPPTTAPVPKDTEPVATTQPAKTDQDYRYFGRRLSASERDVYDQLEEGLKNRKDEIGPLCVSDLDTLREIIHAVFYDYPEYFWFREGYAYPYSDKGTYLEVMVKPMYEFSSQEYLSCKALVESESQYILAQLQGKTDYEKVKGVYEYLIDNTIYDLDYTGTTIYELFHDKRAVCEGYARAAQYLLNKLGVEALYITGLAGEPGEEATWENHAWNIVRIDGSYYQLDVTWGDPVLDDGTQGKNYFYLNLTDEEMYRNHKAEEPDMYPPCTATKYNYYSYEGYYLNEFNQQTLIDWFREADTRGEALEFKCASRQTYEQAKTWMFENGGANEMIRPLVAPNSVITWWWTTDDVMYIISLERT